MRTIGIHVVSRDYPGVVDAAGVSALVSFCAGAFGVKGRDGAIAGAHVAVAHTVGVNVLTGNGRGRVDGVRKEVATEVERPLSQTVSPITENP